MAALILNLELDGSGQIQAPAFLPLEEETPINIGYGIWWAPEPVWT